MNDSFQRLSPQQIIEASEDIITYCRRAWQKDMLSGWSGNVSLLLKKGIVLITAAGCPKGELKPSDLLFIDVNGNSISGSGKASSETALHLEIYRAVADCRAIMHTHPVKLQALSLALGAKRLRENFLNIDLYESEMWRSRLFFAACLSPGTKDLAISAAQALPADNIDLPCAVWLPKHGLCAIGRKLRDAFCLTEELEHLAAAQLLMLACSSESHR